MRVDRQAMLYLLAGFPLTMIGLILLITSSHHKDVSGERPNQPAKWRPSLAATRQSCGFSSSATRDYHFHIHGLNHGRLPDPRPKIGAGQTAQPCCPPLAPERRRRSPARKLHLDDLEDGVLETDLPFGRAHEINPGL